MMNELLIDRLLQVHYPQEFGLDSDGVVVDMTIHRGLVDFSDSKACDDCQELRPQRNSCNRVNLKIDASANPIEIVNFEKYISQFDNTPAAIRDRCDYIFVDATLGHDKIAFCDLTCSEEKYVNPNGGKYPLGKRAKASEQMKKSLEGLLQVPLFAHYILTFPNKICLFGWREYSVSDVTPQRGNAIRNMLAFMSTPSAKCTTLRKMVSIVGYNFSFVQVKYPMVYQW